MKFVRVPADHEAILDKSRYEAFTCLAEGTQFTTDTAAIEFGDGGAPRYSWKRNTAPVGPADEDQWVSAGLMRASQRRYSLEDPATGKPVLYHAGSITHSKWRDKYVMVFCEVQGTSFLGEIWYAESDLPEGPYENPRKIATHTDYNFYNPVQHPDLAPSGGREIYFSGCFVNTFLASRIPVPRYNYNMVMYRLDLADPLLALPPPGK